VIVIGGGWAGMAAAVTLAAAGAPVTVLEGARVLGGRARRVDADGRALDNGLHILIGAYATTLRLIELVAGAGVGLRRSPLRLVLDDGFALSCPRLPAPLHLLAGLLGATGLAWSDRIGACAFMVRVRRTGFRARPGETVEALLDRFRQSRTVRACLWHPLCVAALNTEPEAADAQVFLNVLRDGLAGARRAADLVLPTVDLSALFPEPAARFVADRGGLVSTGVTVRALQRTPTGFTLETTAGPEACDHVICATDPARALGLLGALPGLESTRAALQALRYRPIASVYLQYDPGTRLSAPMLGLMRGPAQWAFDRGTLCGQHGLIGAVTSSATDLDRLEHRVLAAEVHRQLRPSLRSAGEPLWWRVITEKRATFACVPDIVRPPQQTPLPGLYLAGDYTASDYPGTIEAAVRSGVACATAILEER
jgi:squalene-associated FAD-dependent desaturase